MRFRPRTTDSSPSLLSSRDGLAVARRSMIGRFFVASLGCCLALSTLADSCLGQVIYFNNFDQHTKSRKYKEADLDAEWNSPEWDNGVSEGRVKIEHSSKAYGGSGSCLVVKYPKGQYGTKKTGAQWLMPLDGEHTEVLSSYKFKFKNYTDFVKGGKLPGISGGTTPTGSVTATGYNGFTARMMWKTFHTGNPGSPKQRTSQMISYAKYVGSGYDQDGKDEDETYFVDPDGDLSTIRSNRWYEVTQRVRMNDVGQQNGVLQIWLNGDLVVDQQNLEFRKTNSLKIDHFYFSTFFGGGWSWRTSSYTTCYFDDFMITAVE